MAPKKTQDAQKQLLDNSHYDPDLLLDETGSISTFQSVDNPEAPLCVLLKNVLPQSLLEAVRPVVRKAAAVRMFLRFFGLGVLGFEVGERHV